jgi:hypothetical protein
MARITKYSEGVGEQGLVQHVPAPPDALVAVVQIVRPATGASAPDGPSSPTRVPQAQTQTQTDQGDTALVQNEPPPPDKVALEQWNKRTPEVWSSRHAERLIAWTRTCVVVSVLVLFGLMVGGLLLLLLTETQPLAVEYWMATLNVVTGFVGAVIGFFLGVKNIKESSRKDGDKNDSSA